jgi:hypothetical protein
MLLATRPLQAKQLSQPVMLSLQPFCAGDVFLQVKAIRRATRAALLVELAAKRYDFSQRVYDETGNVFEDARARRRFQGVLKSEQRKPRDRPHPITL